ncbi:MAG: hypothetical protein ACKVOU_00565 [Cytophagales bacterium]
MPNYILVSFIILININLAFSQYEKRKLTVDKAAIHKIAEQKLNELKQDVKLTHHQTVQIRHIYAKEAFKIDSLKLLSAEFFEDPLRGREIISEYRHHSEEEILNLLTFQQKRSLHQNRDEKRKKAFQRLQN